jgi:hypothetical protein
MTKTTAELKENSNLDFTKAALSVPVKVKSKKPEQFLYSVKTKDDIKKNGRTYKYDAAKDRHVLCKESTNLDEGKSISFHQVHKKMTQDKIKQMQSEGKNVDALKRKLANHIAQISAQKRGVNFRTEETELEEGSKHGSRPRGGGSRPGSHEVAQAGLAAKKRFRDEMNARIAAKKASQVGYDDDDYPSQKEREEQDKRDERGADRRGGYGKGLEEGFKETEASKRDATFNSAKAKVQQIMAQRRAAQAKADAHPDHDFDHGDSRKARRREMGEAVEQLDEIAPKKISINSVNHPLHKDRKAVRAANPGVHDPEPVRKRYESPYKEKGYEKDISNEDAFKAVSKEGIGTADHVVYSHHKSVMHKGKSVAARHIGTYHSISNDDMGMEDDGSGDKEEIFHHIVHRDADNPRKLHVYQTTAHKKWHGIDESVDLEEGMMDKHYMAGMQAAYAKKPASSNPHDKFSMEHKLWKQGHKDNWKPTPKNKVAEETEMNESYSKGSYAHSVDLLKKDFPKHFVGKNVTVVRHPNNSDHHLVIDHDTECTGSVDHSVAHGHFEPDVESPSAFMNKKDRKEHYMKQMMKWAPHKIPEPTLPGVKKKLKEGTEMTNDAYVKPKSVATDTLEQIRKYDEQLPVVQEEKPDYSYIAQQGFSRKAWHVQESVKVGLESSGAADNAKLKKNLDKGDKKQVELNVAVEKDSNNNDKALAAVKGDGGAKVGKLKEAILALYSKKNLIELEEGWVDDIDKIQVHHHGTSGAGVTVHVGEKKSTQHFPNVKEARKYGKDMHKANGKMAAYEDHTQ